MSIGKMSEINKNILVAEKDSGFEFTFYIEKAQVANDTEQMMIRGIASTSNVDHDQERFAPKALEKMVNIINQKSVPLRVEHSKGQGSVIGNIKKGWLDGRNQFWIEAELDKNNKTASLIYSALKKGAQLGLSVGGRVKRAVMELSEKTGQAVKTFYDVILDEVSVTPRPANYDAWLFSKSIIKKGEDIKSYYSSPLYNQFLATNPQLDYLAVFEKSIPRNSWIKVDNLLNYEPMLNFGKKSISETEISESESSEKIKGLSEKNPTTISDILESSESTDSVSSSSKSFSDNSSRSETSNSSSSSSSPSKSSDSSSRTRTTSTDSSEDESSIETSKSFKAFKNYVVRGFGDIAKAIDQITKVLTYQSSDAPALEQENPNESQESYSDTSSTPETSSRGSIKHQRQGQENTYAEGDNEASRERGSRTSSDTTSALDQENPTETKARRNKQGTNETTGTTVDDDWYNTVNEPTISSPSSSSSDRSKTRKKWWEDTDDIQSERERSRSSSSGDTTSALDQENPTETKRRKTLSSSISESVPTSERTVERTRSSSDSSEESDDEDSDNNKYRMPEVTRSIRNLNAIVKRLQSYQVIKSQSPQTIDEFTKATSAAVMAIGDRLEKEGKRIIGLENRIAEMIRRDEIIQKSIHDMMDQPGAKKSVSLGIPYMVDREGRRYALTAKEISIEKSIKNNKEKDFKEVYKEQLSSEATGM